MSENKTSKYFKYAIGEIILVVIGILIALQINNWNEDRKASLTEAKALKELLIEFKINHKDFSRVYEIKNKTLDSLTNYLNFILDKTIPMDQKSFVFTRIARNTWDPQYSVLNGLFASGTIRNLKNDSLRSYLSYWEGHVSNYMRLQESYEERAVKYQNLKSEIIPRNYKNLGKKNIHSHSKIQEQSKVLIQSILYQNILNSIKFHLGAQLTAMDQVIENYNKIIKVLELEIKNYDKIL